MQERATKLGPVECPHAGFNMLDTHEFSSHKQIQTIPEVQKHYKAYFTGLLEGEKDKFKHERCIVPISLGQYYHEGDHLEALIKLVNKSFSGCTVLIGDLLQRHSLALEFPDKCEDELRDLALAMGQDWLIRNSGYLEQLTIPYDISTCQDWISHHEFVKYTNSINQLYLQDDEYRSTVDRVVNEFIVRTDKRRANINSAAQLSLRYVLEESVFFCLWMRSGYRCDVYPANKINKMLRIIYERLVKPKGADYSSLVVAMKKLGGRIRMPAPGLCVRH